MPAPQQSDREVELKELIKVMLGGSELKEYSPLIMFISSLLQKERERILNILKRVHGEQFSDEVHCTCLAYAIDALEGKSDESKENLKRLQSKVNTQ